MCTVLSYLTVSAGGQSEQVIYQILVNTFVVTALHDHTSQLKLHY